MLRNFFASLGVVLLAVPTFASTSSDVNAAHAACNLLKNTSSTLLFASPGSVQYALDIAHFSLTASQNATCTVEPARLADVVSLVKIITQTRTPWAVKGHGHTYNRDFSSTMGVQISLAQFNEVSYDPTSKSARIGAGTTWGDVYPVLEAHGVTVVGGRVAGIGTGGLILGGGYSYKTNQFGLGSDTTVEYNLVTYAGEILQVNSTSYPDLFFALQGGLNNFGIVTSYTMKTHIQTRVVGGFLSIPPQNVSALKQAIVNFSLKNRDPKAIVNPIFTYGGGQLSGFVYILYDGPTVPENTFNDFISLGANITQTSYSDFIEGPPSGSAIPTRHAQHPAPIVSYTSELMDFIANETESIGRLLTTKYSGTSVNSTVEIFLPTAFSASRNAAYPHSLKQFWNPLDASATWVNASEDSIFSEAIKSMAGRIQTKAIELGQSSPDAILYSNYAVADTPLHLMYGDNVARLARISKFYDPSDLISLTGGFKFSS